MNMKVFGGLEKDENTYVSVIAQNVGDRPTTITNLGGMFYESWWKAYLFRNRPDEAFVVQAPSDSQPIPHRFDIGTQWMGTFPQRNEIEEQAKNGYLFLILYTACNGSGKRVRVTFKREK
ncbi:hypothetical protein KUL49_15150 [Alteromonas sp. KUL49]|nr:hypothetical protein KUL49_15150 [Alteromonas sp. KUL49]